MTGRVAPLVAAMTIEEKALLLEGVDSWHTNAVPRLGIPALCLTDGPHGVRKVREGAGAFGLTDLVPSTGFPTSVTVASSWDPELARRMGAAIARECIELGVDVLLAPGVNIKRNPLCGRNFEYYSEDPLVSGVFGSAFVQGVQAEGVGACVKHLAANSNEDYRFVGDSLVDERALREIYLRAFERIVKQAAPATVMCAYNALNGTFCADDRGLLTGILRDEWGFDGLVMTDWGATHDRVAGVLAGCDLDMPGEVLHNRRRIVDAVRDGTIPEAVLDASVGRVLALVDRCRAEAPAGSGARAGEDRGADLAAEIAVESAVLLTNDGTLPLQAGRLVVVGELFERMRFQGAGSSLINVAEVVTPKDAFDRRGVAYEYHRGYRGLDSVPDPDLTAAAVAAARDGGTVLFFGGLGDLEESEGFDRTSMRLGAPQTALLDALLDAGARVVLVLFAGAPVELPMLDRLAAVLCMHLPGMHGGEATAALLLGEANPSGRLAESWPLTAADASSAADFDRGGIAQYFESVYVGYRCYDAAGTTLRFPFGHGLSYTAFAYRDLSVRTVGDRVQVAARIANTGARDGAEVVQLYVRNAASAVFKADKELRSFTKVSVPAGGEVAVALSFPIAELAYWDVAEHGWVLEGGEYEVVLAASAADPRLVAPLPVEGRPSRSPYPAAVDAAYAQPPARVPPEFAALLGRPVPRERRSHRLTLETRLADARPSVIGRLVLTGVMFAVRREYRRALALPDSLERDTRVKNAHFVMRMMPSVSLRAMVMASGGAFPYRAAVAVADLAAGHPIRAVRRLVRPE